MIELAILVAFHKSILWIPLTAEEKKEKVEKKHILKDDGLKITTKPVVSKNHRSNKLTTGGNEFLNAYGYFPKFKNIYSDNHESILCTNFNDSKCLMAFGSNKNYILGLPNDEFYKKPLQKHIFEKSVIANTIIKISNRVAV